VNDFADVVRGAILAVAALMPIVNPLGSAPIFLSMTADLPVPARRYLSRQVGWNSFMMLAAAMLVGSHVLRAFGISVPIVRVGGGLLVIASGWRLLNSNDEAPANAKPAVAEAWEREAARRAFYPLTFPLTVGPGSISIAITLGAGISARGSGLANLVSDIVGVTIVAVVVYLSYRFASRLIAFLGDTGAMVFLRLSAFILLCVGVSIMWGGITDLVLPLLGATR
jgi:multiple antibiotic resistance protein